LYSDVVAKLNSVPRDGLVRTNFGSPDIVAVVPTTYVPSATCEAQRSIRKVPTLAAPDVLAHATMGELINLVTQLRLAHPAYPRPRRKKTRQLDAAPNRS
jgi:hypothetical protein